MEMKILKYDTSLLASKNETELIDYLKDETNYSIVPFKPK